MHTFNGNIAKPPPVRYGSWFLHKKSILRAKTAHTYFTFYFLHTFRHLPNLTSVGSNFGGIFIDFGQMQTYQWHGMIWIFHDF